MIALEVLKQLLKNKYGLYVVIAALVAFGGWKAHEWYVGDNTRAHLERAINQANELAKQDAELLLEGIQAEQIVITKFVKVRDESYKTELCSNGGADFHRLFNDAVGAANSK